MRHAKDNGRMQFFKVLMLSCAVIPLPELRAQEMNFEPEFFAFQTGFANAATKDPAYLTDLVHEAGFDGVELMGLDQVEAFLPQLTKRKLSLHALYLKLDIDSSQPYDSRLKTMLAKHRGKIHYLWFHIHSSKHARSDPSGDQRCVEILQELADFAKPLDVRIGVYMHVGLWAEKFSDGVRIARKVKRENVGAVFNLCHYLRTVGPKNMEKELSNAFPHVTLVSINGADDGDTKKMGWDRLIQPLGEGTFDVLRVLKVLKEKNYTGPVGLQGYGVPRKPEDFFPSSVKAWKEMLKKLHG